MLHASPVVNPSFRPRPPGACCNDACRHASACEATRGGTPALLGLRQIVERVGPFSDGDRLVQPEAPHRAAFAVLSGFAATVSATGRVLAFHLPGELFALDVARSQKHGTSVMAIGKTWFCRFPRDATETLCEHNDDVARHLASLRRRERRPAFRGARQEGLAAERMSAFLDDLLLRRRHIEGPGHAIPLPMSREQIASYLDMSAATVTRMLARLRADGTLRITADGVEVLNEAALRDATGQAGA